MLETDLLRIAINATFFSERLHNPEFRNAYPNKFDQDIIDQRIETWCKTIGGEEELKKRLSYDNLDLNTVRFFLGSINLVENYTLPSWAKTLKELIENNSTWLLYTQREEKLPIDSQKSLPFEDFYVPSIILARHKLYANLSLNNPLAFLHQEAYKSLERNLLKQLVNLGTETLLFEFNKLREHNSSQNITTPEESQSKVLYNFFIQNLLQDGGLKFFQRYPVLARLIVTTVDLWVESITEFIQRLQADLSAIEATFCDNSSIGKVKEIETSLSNPHNGGRCVLAITFSSGVKIVYKPKDLSLDIAFNQVLDWCNQQHITLPFKVIKFLYRRTYSWVEFIDHKPCENQDAVRRFYKRAGMLLSLLYVLGASNCHNENIIANGDFPILIDADILMYPLQKSLNESQDWFKYTVLNTGFLPGWEGDIYSPNAQDSSVLGNIYPQQVNSSREWKFINTDKMCLVSKTVVIPPKNNVVIINGKTVFPKEYTAEIITGFEEIYKLLRKHRNPLLEKNGILSFLKNLKSRFILRPTIIYGLILKYSLSPQYLSDGLDYSILISTLIDTLGHSYLKLVDNQNLRAIYKAETESLQQRDVPYFSVSCANAYLEAEPDISIKHFFRNYSYQHLVTQLQKLNENDLYVQIQLIRLSFYAKEAHLIKQSAVLQGNFSQLSSPTPEELLKEAIEIGNSLVANVIRTADGCDWISLEYMLKANRYQLRSLDDSLYTGRAGVSLFLAALAKITGKNEFHNIALAGLSSFRQSLKKAEVRQEILRSEFGLLGIGGIIYSLVKISQFLQEPSLLVDAEQAAKLLTQQVIAADEKLDMMWGVAGAIPGLLSLYNQTGKKAVLDIAVDCGEHLLSKRTHSVPRAWVTVESNKPLTGFSHGAAGISLSILRLYAATANTAFLEAATEAIEYERSVFDKSVRNWPDFRLSEKTNKINFLHTWCHGSPGIGLARLAGLPIIQTEETHSEIDIALETTLKYGVSSSDVDFLCCGHMGRIELFVLASQKLGEQEWLKIARRQSVYVLTRAKENGEYAFLPHLTSSVFSPSFYRGYAGVGYQLLRLASPNSLPSVLIWE